MSGKKRWVTRTVRGGKRDAQRALAALVAEVDRGTIAPSGVTVGEVLERWFEHASSDLSPKTVLETRGILDRYLLPAVGDVRLARLRTADVDKLYANLRARGGQGGRPLAPATVRRIHVVLRRALAQAARWGWLTVNPAAAASPPRTVATDIKPPSPSEVARLFRLAEETDPDLATFVVLAAATGARRSEVVALRWADVDLEGGSVTIGRGIVMGPDGLVEKGTKTHSVRTVSLDPTVVKRLEAHRVAVEERAGVCGVRLKASAFVFTGAVDGSIAWRPDSTTRAFARLCKQAGLEGVRLHDLRHYVATRLLAAGVDARTVAGRLGHRNASTTLNVYSHFLPEADRQAANVLGDLFDTALAEESADKRA